MQFKSKMERSKNAILGIVLIIIAAILFMIPNQIHEELLKDARSEWYLDELNNGTLDDTSREIHERLMEESPEYISAIRDSTPHVMWTDQERFLQAGQIQQDLFEKEIEKLVAPRVTAKENPFYIFGTIFLVGGVFLILWKKRKLVEDIPTVEEDISADNGTLEPPQFLQEGSSSLREKFQEYLIKCGYKTVTPSGNPSTVYDYLKRIDKVCEYEHMTYDLLASNIERIVMEYDIGGSKEEFGKASHNAVINALRRFQEFCQGRHTE